MIRNLKVKTGTQATHRHIINMQITVKDGLVSDSLIVSIIIQSSYHSHGNNCEMVIFGE